MAREPTRVVVADELPPAAFEQLRRPGWEVTATFGRPREELTRALAGADALVVRSATRVTADLIGEAPQLLGRHLRVVLPALEIEAFAQDFGHVLRRVDLDPVLQAGLRQSGARDE